MNQTSWSIETKKVFNGILLFSVAWIAYGIFSPVESLVSGADTLASFAGSSGSGAAGSLLSIVTYVLLLGIGAGYLLTIAGLGKFGNILDDADRGAILSVRMAFIIALIAVALDVLPFIPDIVGDIVYLVAIILMLLRYGSLKKSATFAGKAGASTLFVAMILLVVGWGLDFIPLVGDWLESLLTIIAYIMTLLGWNKIKNAAVAG